MTNRKKHRSIQWEDVWNNVRKVLSRLGAPKEVQEAAMSTEIRWESRNGVFVLHCSEILYKYMEVPETGDESRIGNFKQALWPFMVQHGCLKMRYETNQ